MVRADVAVIDYGVGNLLSVRRGLEHCGAVVSVTADRDAILAAPRVVLPGVGAFGRAMQELRRLGLNDVVAEVAQRQRPLLGICLGMEMLLDESEEFGLHSGLGLIPGRIVPIPSLTPAGRPQKIPHIGWSGLTMAEGRDSWSGTVLQDVAAGEPMYFVHSFMACPLDPRHRIADCLYGDVRVAAVIGADNLLGTQFHPEKSAVMGLKVLQRFLQM
jgi:glutamine amidotransferase